MELMYNYFYLIFIIILGWEIYQYLFGDDDDE
jgi:hypothetical protein